MAVLDKPIQLKDELDEYFRQALRNKRLQISNPVLHIGLGPVKWPPIIQTNLDFVNHHSLIIAAHLASMEDLEPHVVPPLLHPIYRFHAHSALESTWLCCRVALKLAALPEIAPVAPTIYLSFLASACTILQKLGCIQQMVPFAIDVLYYLQAFNLSHPLTKSIRDALNLWFHYLAVVKESAVSPPVVQ